MAKKKVNNNRGFTTTSIPKPKIVDPDVKEEIKSKPLAKGITAKVDKNKKEQVKKSKPLIEDPQSVELANKLRSASKLESQSVKRIEQVQDIVNRLNIDPTKVSGNVMGVDVSSKSYQKLVNWCSKADAQLTSPLPTPEASQASPNVIYSSDSSTPGLSYLLSNSTYQTKLDSKVLKEKLISSIHEAYTFAIQLGFNQSQVEARTQRLGLMCTIPNLMNALILDSEDMEVPLMFRDAVIAKDDKERSKLKLKANKEKESGSLSEISSGQHTPTLPKEPLPLKLATPPPNPIPKPNEEPALDPKDFGPYDIYSSSDDEDYAYDPTINEIYGQASQDKQVYQNLLFQAQAKNHIYFINILRHKLAKLDDRMEKMRSGLLFKEKDVKLVSEELKDGLNDRIDMLKDVISVFYDDELAAWVDSSKKKDVGDNKKDKNNEVLAVGEEGDEMFDFDSIFQSEPTEDLLPTQSSPELNDASFTPEFPATMQIPKTWTGKSPRLIFQSLCKGKKATVTYRTNPRTNLTTLDLSYKLGNSTQTDQFKSNQSVFNFKKTNGYNVETKAQGEDLVACIALFILGWLGNFTVLPPNFRELVQYWHTRKTQSQAEQENEGLLKGYEFVERVADSCFDELTQGKKLGAGKDNSTQKNGSESKNRTGSKGKSDYWANQKLDIKQQFAARKAESSYRPIHAIRSQLPIASYKSELLAAINQDYTNPSKSYNPSDQILLVVGETGCGKTTQVPQFLVEHAIEMEKVDKCNVLCTQPRRISAISIAERVSQELGDGIDKLGRDGSLVGYQVRLASKTNPSNLLTFCTMGVLLRRLEQDPKLLTLTHLVIDEIQERSLESDFLLAVVKRILSEPTHLKVILMSATIDQATFSEYFFNCPVLTVPGRTFPVEVKYLEDVVRSTGYVIDKESRYAVRESGSREVEGVGKGGRGGQRRMLVDDFELMNKDAKNEDPAAATLAAMREDMINYDFISYVIQYICTTSDPTIPKGAVIVFLPGIPEIKLLDHTLQSVLSSAPRNNVRILQAHSAIPPEKQKEIFKVLSGVRKVVLATNVAETGITIPDATIVLDTGRMKQVRFDKKLKVRHLDEVWVAKANAKQRTGRAGRVQQGLCFRLFTEKKFNEMIDYQIPEMMRLPLEELCLNVKVYGYDEIKPFLMASINPPNPAQIDTSITLLKEVGALDPLENLTPLGLQLARLPVDVYLGKLMIYSARLLCLDAALSIAAALSYKSPFLPPNPDAPTKADPHAKYLRGSCDFLTGYQTYKGWRNSMNKGGVRKAMTYCTENGLSYQVLSEMENVKGQFLRLLGSAGVIDTREKYDGERTHPDIVKIPSTYNKYNDNDGIVKLALMSGLYPNLLIHTNSLLNKASLPIIPSTSNHLTLTTLLATQAHLPVLTPVNLHISSSLAKLLKANSSSEVPQLDPDLRVAVFYEMMKTNHKLSTRQISLMTPLPMILVSKHYTPLYPERAVLLDQGVIVKCPPKLAQCFDVARTGFKQVLDGEKDYGSILELIAELVGEMA